MTFSGREQLTFSCMNKSYLESIQSRSSQEDTGLPEARDDKVNIGTGTIPDADFSRLNLHFQ